MRTGLALSLGMNWKDIFQKNETRKELAEITGFFDKERSLIKTMVFKTILKKNIAREGEKGNRNDSKVKLPSELQGWIKEYEKAGKR